jgi:hypothetical protein
MNIKILLLALSAAAISSCSTAYKSGQTPDDVYYSPARVVEEDNHTNREEVKKDNFEDREIRMAVYDRRWRDFNDDYNCRYDPYTYGYNYGYYYNPFYCFYPVYLTNVVISNPKNTVPRMTNLGSYNNTTYAITNTKYGNGVRIITNRPYNNSNNNNTFIRRILTTPSNNSNSTESNNNNTRSYTPSSSNSSSGSSSGNSGGTPVTRPARGG